MPGLLWDLIARDGASPAFLRVAGAADKAAVSTAKAAAGSEAAAARMARAGKTLTHNVTLPLAAVAAVSLDMAAKFQQSTNVLVTAAGESAANLGKVRKGILDVATSTGTGWKDVTDAVYVAEKAGYRGANAITLVKAAAQGAREEGAKLSTVLNAQTSIMASYHMPASKSVQVINMMKTAAGEAKTTMEMFAGSLSTVLPIASANKISFADVAGTLASLTQHGTSADEAAQELAFTMRGLAAPSQVAVKEMAQLGVNSIDVSKRLGDGPGGRGLAGTLNYLSQTVLKRMGPSGKVLLSTFNASKVAAHDAAIEYNALAPATQKLAKAYIDGTIKQGDWTKGVKALTPEQANLAKQFAVTENGARGFQAAIRSGVNGSQTYSDAIKKMTGGANGLNVVLQATGASTAGTTERIKRIADAALGAGKNVSGWASTQKLFSVQLDIAKQKLAAVGIQIGTALIPTFVKGVSAVGGAVSAFSRLSSTQKSMLAWGAGIAFAMGPVLSIGAKLSGVGSAIARFSTAAVSQMSRFSTRMAMNAEGISGAMGKVGGAIGGAAIGVAVGSLTANSSNAVKAMGVLGSAAAGAAMGFGAGGGIGAVIGGLAGGLSALATQFFTAGDAAKHQIPKISGLTEALTADNAAVGKNSEALVANSLQSNGLYEAGLKLGISQRTLTLAAEGNTAALQKVNRTLTLTEIQGYQAASSGRALTAAQRAAGAAADKLTSGLGDVSGQLRQATGAAYNIDAGLGKLSNTTAGAAGRMNSMGQAAHDAVGGLSGTAASAAGASGKIAGMDQSAINALGSLSNLASPHSVNVDTSAAIAQINALAGAASGLGSTLAASQGSKLSNRIGGFATGTNGKGLPEGVSAVGEAGAELAIKRGAHVDILSNRQSRSFLAATGLRAPGFASGTGGSGASLMAAIQAAGFRGNAAAIMYGIVMAESGGNARAHNGNAGTGDNSYGLAQINMLGSMGPARRAQYGLSSNSQLYDPATNLRIAYAMSGHGTHFGDWSTYNSGAYRAAMGQTGATIRNGGSGLGSVGMSVASLANLRIKLNQQDLDRLRNSLKSTAYSVRTAFNTIFSDMTRVGAPGSVTSMLQGIETRVLAIQSKVAKANTLWTSMATYRQGVATTLDGFDPTKAGSVADLVAGYGGATSKNMAYTSELNKLRAKTKGNTVLTGLVNTLAASGQTATLQTLAGASSGQLAQVAKSVGAYDSSVWAGADSATAEKFGGNTLAQQTRNVNKLTSEMNGFVQVVAQLAHEVGRQTITVNIDGEKHAAKVTNSKAMQHLLAELEHIIAKGH